MPITPGQISETTNFLTAVGGSICGGGAVVIMARALLKRFLADLKDLKAGQDAINAEMARRKDSIEKELKLFVLKNDCNKDQSACSQNIGRTLDEIKSMIVRLDERIFDLVKKEGTDRRERDTPWGVNK